MPYNNIPSVHELNYLIQRYGVDDWIKTLVLLLLLFSSRNPSHQPRYYKTETKGWKVKLQTNCILK